MRLLNYLRNTYFAKILIVLMVVFDLVSQIENQNLLIICYILSITSFILYEFYLFNRSFRETKTWLEIGLFSITVSVLFSYHWGRGSSILESVSILNEYYEYISYVRSAGRGL